MFKKTGREGKTSVIQCPYITGKWGSRVLVFSECHSEHVGEFAASGKVLGILRKARATYPSNSWECHLDVNLPLL